VDAIRHPRLYVMQGLTGCSGTGIVYENDSQTALLHLARINFDRSEVRWTEVWYAFAGRVVGSVLAATVIAALADKQFISICVAVAVLAGVAVSLTSFTVAINPGSLLGAGFMSGAMATLTSVGAPPMALLYQRKSFGLTRATLNAFFLFGAAASVGALLLYGLVSAADAWMALALLPAIAIGTLLGDVALSRLTITTLRPFTLIISTFAAIVLLLRTLW
jgi:uncharacterized protein